MGRLLRAMAVTLVAVGLVTGCDDQPNTTTRSSVPSEAEEPSTQEPVEAPPAPSASFSTASHLDVDVDSEDGSTYHLSLGLAEAVRASDLIAPADFPDVGACEIDPQRDLVIPARITAQSTTPGFDIEMDGELNAYLDGETPFEGLSIEGDNTYSDGSTCDPRQSPGVGSRIAAPTWSGAGEGDSASHAFYVVVHDYFTPQHPTGDQGGLARRALYFSAGPGFQYSNGQGTGVRDLGHGIDGVEVFALPLLDTIRNVE